MKLIEKMRALNHLLQKTAGSAVSFMEMTEVLSKTIHSSSFVMSRKGKLLGYDLLDQALSDSIHQVIFAEKKISSEHNSLLFSITETVSNSNDIPNQLHTIEQIRLWFGFPHLMIVPILGV